MTFTSILPKMGQSKSTEKQDTDETNSTEVKTRKTKSGSLFCSNWKNVGFCTNGNTINVYEHEPVNRQIEGRSNGSSNVRDQSTQIENNVADDLTDFTEDLMTDSNAVIEKEANTSNEDGQSTGRL